jgi:hypothetical protein
MIALPLPARDLVAPLGLVFIDGPGGAPILTGLSVRAWPEGREDRARTATINGAGVAGFHRLPGVQFDPADPFVGPTRPFIVEVTDALRRFQTGRVRVLAPARGVTSVVMRSSPTRVVEPGRITFRSELWDAVNDRPAAFALVIVKLVGNGGTVPATTLTAGLTDAAGRLLAVADWPAPKVPLSGPAPTVPLRWNAPRALTLELLYDPAAPRDVVRLDLVTSAPAARAWNRRGPDEAYAPPDLTVDRPVVLRSAGDADGRLLVTVP